MKSACNQSSGCCAAHSSFPQGKGSAQWLSRYTSFAIASGADPVQVEGARGSVEAHLNLLSPEQDEAVLREAGFSDVTPFYAAFLALLGGLRLMRAGFPMPCAERHEVPDNAGLEIADERGRVAS